MECTTCKNWICQRVTKYQNLEIIVNYQAAEGRGMCEALKFETEADFGCVKYIEGHEHVEVIATKTGSPWMHFQWGGCPVCGGTAPDRNGNFTYGDPKGGCVKCQTTGRCRYYDDGFIADEATRRHPNENLLGPPPKPQCFECDAVLEPQWKACPHCGRKVEVPEVVKIEGLVFDNTRPNDNDGVARKELQ